MGRGETAICWDCEEYHYLGKARLSGLSSWSLQNEDVEDVIGPKHDAAIELATFVNEHSGCSITLAPSRDLDHLDYDFNSEHLRSGERLFTSWLDDDDE